MPNRILKESILDSPTLARLEDFTQDQFPRFLLLADDWGCFNADPDFIKGRAYPKRPKVTPKVITAVLRNFHDSGMLFLWLDIERTYGYWVGWNTHNYCNTSAVEEDGKQAKHRRKTPPPPEKELNEYVAEHQNKLEQLRTNTLIPIPIPIPIPNPKKIDNARAGKTAFGEGQNVWLTDSEHQKLIERFTEPGARERIAAADEYFGSKGVAGQYASHYMTILNWDRRQSKNGTGKPRASPAKPTEAEIAREHEAMFGGRKKVT